MVNFFDYYLLNQLSSGSFIFCLNLTFRKYRIIERIVSRILTDTDEMTTVEPELVYFTYYYILIKIKVHIYYI